LFHGAPCWLELAHPSVGLAVLFLQTPVSH
jgi:hypothetical protein